MSQSVNPLPGYLHELDTGPTQQPITVTRLAALRGKGEKIAVLTCYDASFAALLNQCGVEVLLVGDSLGMVCQGHSSTVPVRLADIAYHTASVARGNRTALLMADLPVGALASPADTYRQATTLMRAGAHMVKLEGGGWLADTVQFLTQRGVPVCGHLGLMPQSIHLLGGYKIQGKTIENAAALKADALALQAAGASMVLLEAIPSTLGTEITAALSIPTIGIGAGPDCSGQVLVLHDLLDVFPGRKPRFVKNFMAGKTSIQAAVAAYVAEVKAKTFPAAEHCF
ncbi:MAG: 3-methyl-2-oxobutanoate hydroxymethyltransferase [Stagnimonas sp.]|nr:3-methyl-2-oxobutanoate hydroxymethyltransferase [Stagnimonas sp.]